jgi:methionine-rich copper-binding protein CopC
MSRRTTIILTTLVLLLGVVLAGVYIRDNNASGSGTVNAPVATGISLLFSEPLTSEFTAIVTDSDNKEVKTLTLEKAASRFNIELPSGVYQVTIKPKDNSLPPFPTSTITVSDGTLSELNLNIPHAEE